MCERAHLINREHIHHWHGFCVLDLTVTDFFWHLTMDLNEKFPGSNSHLQTILLILVIVFAAIEIRAQDVVQQPRVTNNVVIELFYRSDSPQSINAEEYLRQLQQRRPGIEIKTYDVLSDKQQLKRLWEISKNAGREKAGLPTFYLCDRLKVGFRDAQSSGAQIEDLLNIRAYLRPGCQHCKAGKEFLDQMILRWPAIKIEYFDVISDFRARAEVQNLAAKYHVQVASFPCIEVAGHLVVGFETAETTGSKIEILFQDRSVDFPDNDPAPRQEGENGSIEPANPRADGNGPSFFFDEQANGSRIQTLSRWEPSFRWTPGSVAESRLSVSLLPVSFLRSAGNSNRYSAQEPEGQENPAEPSLPKAVQLPDDVPLPEEAGVPDEVGDATVIFGPGSAGMDSDEVEVPVFGRISVSKIGLPAFTFLIGLIDGFNPCAMWVLVFLLSVLVSLKERKKILLVAGTFVVVSGLAYFVFIAAWFNVFQLIGFLRPVQIGLGILAIVVGLVNVKDFFAFHKGLTLSIPESAKPGIYRRVRSIVSANHLYTALVAAVVLAIVVNVVELLCTAGLPALYTGVLTMQNLPTWVNYAYLGLYICAYMLDDTILVVIVVATLSNRRLQESEGKWLKLLSGSVILLLGIVMIFRPNWLV